MLLVSAFPGVGKSTMTKDHPEISDSDSSRFPKDNFPANYIAHIKERLAENKPTFISSHDSIRKALLEEGIPYILVYPHPLLKSEYIERYKNRGNSESFIEQLDIHWDSWIAGCANQEGCVKRVLVSGEYLSDAISYVDGQFYINLNDDLASLESWKSVHL